MEFKTQPYKHQLQAFERSRNQEYFALLLEQGLGKTKITLDTAAWLFEQGKIQRLMILAPNGVHTNWIKNEIPKHYPGDTICSLWTGAPGQRKTQELTTLIRWRDNDRLLVFAMNIEAIRTDRGSWWAEWFIRNGPTMLVIDESTSIKNVNAKQTKRAFTLGQKAIYRRILTGTPVANTVVDLYSQCRFLDKRALPMGTFTSFKASFTIEEIITLGPRSFKKIVGFRNLDKLAEYMAPFSLRLEKKDCLDLPEKVYQTRYVPLSKEQESLYRQVKKEAIIEIANGTLTTVNALGILGKCLQICMGFVYDDAKRFHELPNQRITALLNELQEAPEQKHVIWIPFRGLQDYILSKLPRGSAVAYTGAVSNNDRHDAVTRFQEDPSCLYFVATSAASKGLNLQAAHHVIYYGNTVKLEDRIQSEDRVHRIGQKETCVYLDLVTENTADEHIIKLRNDKKSVAEMFTNNIKALLDII